MGGARSCLGKPFFSDDGDPTVVPKINEGLRDAEEKLTQTRFFSDIGKEEETLLWRTGVTSQTKHRKKKKKKVQRSVREGKKEAEDASPAPLGSIKGKGKKKRHHGVLILPRPHKREGSSQDLRNTFSLWTYTEERLQQRFREKGRQRSGRNSKRYNRTYRSHLPGGHDNLREGAGLRMTRNEGIEGVKRTRRCEPHMGNTSSTRKRGSPKRGDVSLENLVGPFERICGPNREGGDDFLPACGGEHFQVGRGGLEKKGKQDYFLKPFFFKKKKS